MSIWICAVSAPIHLRCGRPGRTIDVAIDSSAITVDNTSDVETAQLYGEIKLRTRVLRQMNASSDQLAPAIHVPPPVGVSLRWWAVLAAIAVPAVMGVVF